MRIYTIHLGAREDLVFWVGKRSSAFLFSAFLEER